MVMTKETLLVGRVHMVQGAGGKPIDNIDTYMIFHNAHLAITEIGPRLQAERNSGTMGAGGQTP